MSFGEVWESFGSAERLFCPIFFYCVIIQNSWESIYYVVVNESPTARTSSSSLISLA